MADFDIEEVIREASYKNKKGYIDINSTDDVKFLENIMYEMEYPPDFIGGYMDNIIYENMKSKVYKFQSKDLLNEGILDSIKKFFSIAWQKLKFIIGNSFNSAAIALSDDYTFDKEYTIVIPAQLSEQINIASKLLFEAGITAMKGLYSESLVCQKIWKYSGDKSVVNIDTKKYKNARKEIDSNVKRYKKEISDEKILNEVDVASEAMSKYLINSAKEDGVVIVGAFLSGMERNVGEKKDISIVVKRGMLPEEIENYSLKLYKSKSINLTNMTMRSLIYNLTNPTGIPEKKGNDNEYTLTAKKEMELLKKKSDTYRKEFENAVESDKKMLDLKKTIDKESLEYKEIVSYVKNNENGTMSLKQLKSVLSEYPNNIYVPTVLKIASLREKRNKHRNPLNPIHATIVFKIFRDFIKDEDNKKIFVRNLLQSIGFSGSETRMLLTIMGSKGGNKIVKELVDQHPEFDLTNINLTKPSNITVRVNNGEEVIIKLDFKEGERNIIAGRVDFSKITPVPNEFWQDFK